MASETKPEKRNVEDARKDLKLDPPSEATDIQPSEGKDRRPSVAASGISSGDAMRSIKESEVDQEDFIAVPGMYYPVNDYYGYYYPGLSFGEWDDRGCFPVTAGLEVQHPAIQADNASAVYYFPGLQHGYTPYSPFLPGAIIGADGQYFGQEPYNPTPFFSQSLLSPGQLPQPVIYGPEPIPAYTWESSIFSDGLHGNGFNGYLTAPASKSNFPSRDSKFASSKYSALSKSDDLDKKGSSPTLYISPNHAAHNQPVKPVNKAAAVLSESVLPVNKFSSRSNHGNNSLLHPHSLINIKENGGCWAVTDKVKARNKTYMVGDSDTLNEQNRGPRTSNPKHNLISGIKPVGSLGTEKIGSSKTLAAAVKKDDCNLLDFPTEYDHTLFFVIKSYSEDDIHKSIKYNVWASTSNGNKRLDNAYQVAQEKMVEKGCKCPVFLFFSVNASGQFCGVAEMIGRVDFTKNMDFWQQDKWNGAFPVKWHIIKDVPNPQFRHIILENNDNRPVTNSRDTQEVKFLQGSEMLNIFKSYSSKTSILDDFDFYEHRQKAMESRKTKPLIQSLEHSWSKTDETAQVKEPGDIKPSVSSLQSNEPALTMTKEDLLVQG